MNHDKKVFFFFNSNTISFLMFYVDTTFNLNQAEYEKREYNLLYINISIEWTITCRQIRLKKRTFVFNINQGNYGYSMSTLSLFTQNYIFRTENKKYHYFI